MQRTGSQISPTLRHTPFITSSQTLIYFYLQSHDKRMNTQQPQGSVAVSYKKSHWNDHMITSRVTSCVRHYAQVGWHPASSPATVEGLISRVSGLRSPGCLRERWRLGCVTQNNVTWLWNQSIVTFPSRTWVAGAAARLPSKCLLPACCCWCSRKDLWAREQNAAYTPALASPQANEQQRACGVWAGSVITFECAIEPPSIPHTHVTRALRVIMSFVFYYKHALA